MYINPNTYLELDDCYQLCMMCKSKPYYTYFDKCLFDKLNKYHWRLSQKKNKYYVCTGHGKNGNKIHYMSNIIMNFIPNKIQEVDHIDGDSLNNKLNNLRIINRIDNIQNIKVRCDNKSTGIRGISLDKRYNTYVVDFIYNGKRFYFKQFKLLEDAVYIRTLCEKHFLKEFRNTSDDEYKNSLIDKISTARKLELESYVAKKIGELNV